nr:uncharacterized protein LOC129015147 [Pongo pygmaeus]
MGRLTPWRPGTPLILGPAGVRRKCRRTRRKVICRIQNEQNKTPSLQEEVRSPVGAAGPARNNLDMWGAPWLTLMSRRLEPAPGSAVFVSDAEPVLQLVTEASPKGKGWTRGAPDTIETQKIRRSGGSCSIQADMPAVKEESPLKPPEGMEQDPALLEEVGHPVADAGPTHRGGTPRCPALQPGDSHHPVFPKEMIYNRMTKRHKQTNI